MHGHSQSVFGRAYFSQPLIINFTNATNQPKFNQISRKVAQLGVGVALLRTHSTISHRHRAFLAEDSDTLLMLRGRTSNPSEAEPLVLKAEMNSAYSMYPSLSLST